MSRPGWLRRAASPTALLAFLALAAASRAWRGPEAPGPLRTLTMFSGGSEWIAGLAFAPDGESLTVLATDGAVIACGVKGGGCRQVLPGAVGPTYQLELAPDFKSLARVGARGVVTVWDLDSGQSRPGPWEQVPSDGTSALGYSGSLLALGDSQGTVRLWQTGGGTPCGTLQHGRSPVRNLIFTRDGAALVARHRDSSVVVWDLRTGRVMAEVPPPTVPSNCGAASPAIALAPDGKSVALSWQNDRSVKVYDLRTGRETFTLRGDTASVRCLAYSSDGRLIASGDWSGRVKLWDGATGEGLAGFRGQTLQVVALAFSPDQTTLASGGAEEGIYLWDLRRVLTSPRRRDALSTDCAAATLDAFGSFGRPGRQACPALGSAWNKRSGNTMSTITETPAPPTVAASPSALIPEPVGPKKLWTTAEFDELVRTGLIPEGSRAFLWNGEIIEPMAENPPHVHATMNLLVLLLARLNAADWTVNLDKPLEIRDGYKPEPDLTVLKGPRDQFDTRAPVASDVVLLVEVSDSSYPKDSVPFLREYASAGITQYWIVNIPERRVEVYRTPSGPGTETPGYARRDDFGLEAAVPLSIESANGVSTFEEISVAAILRNSLAAATAEAGPA